MMPRHVLILDSPGQVLDDLRAALASVLEPSVHIEVLRGAGDALRRVGQEPVIDVFVVPYPEGDGQTPATEIMGQIRARDAVLPIVTIPLIPMACAFWARGQF